MPPEPALTEATVVEPDAPAAVVPADTATVVTDAAALVAPVDMEPEVLPAWVVVIVTAFTTSRTVTDRY